MNDKLTKKVVESSKNDIENRSDWIIREIIKDENLRDIWEKNQIAIDDDPDLDMTTLQKESYLIAKTILMDCIQMWAKMDEDDRLTSLEAKNGLYSRIDKYMKLVHDLENKARSRQIKRIEAKEAIDNPFKNAKALEVEFNNGEKARIERQPGEADEQV